MPEYQLVVFDMAGTTVRDSGEVERCFLQAAQRTGLKASTGEILAMMGWSKRKVFETLWERHVGTDADDLRARTDRSYKEFCRVLEHHYETQPVEPSEGCLDCFAMLKRRGTAVALTTGFYRKVTNVILRRLGWDKGLDGRYVGSADSLIQASVCSDEVAHGRPAPEMIRRAMDLVDVTDAARVVKIGDTPSDLQAGKNAGCGLTLGVTNGTHTVEQLREHPSDGLLGSLRELEQWLKD